MGRAPGSGSTYSATVRAEALFLRDLGVTRPRINELLPELRGKSKATVASFEKSRDVNGWVPPPVSAQRQEELRAMAKGEPVPEQSSLLPERAPMAPPQRAVPINNAEDHDVPSLDDLLAVYAERRGVDMNQLGVDHSQLLAEIDSLKEAARELAEANAELEEANESLAEENVTLNKRFQDWRARSLAAERLLAFYMADNYTEKENT